MLYVMSWRVFVTRNDIKIIGGQVIRIATQCTQWEGNLLVLGQFDLACKRFSLICFSSLLVSALVVAALWPVVAPVTLLSWLASLWLIMLARYFHVQRFLRLGLSITTGLGKWKAGFVISSAAAGVCWGATVIYFPVSPFDQATVMLILAIAGVTAFNKISVLTVPVATAAFPVSALLPVAVWFFSFG